MDMQQITGNGFTTFIVKGRLDATTAPVAETTLTNSIVAGALNLVLNLAAADYISSAGLRLLVATHKKLSGQSGKLVLCELQPGVREVIEISGLLDWFMIAATEAEAQSLVAQ
jgi:stage II sporulation protein AA (anti-sigma F factor antagonist)